MNKKEKGGYMKAMKPLYLRPLTEEESEGLKRGLKSPSGFTVRRSQMLLLSAEQGLKVEEIGKRLGCRGQAVREAIHAFEQDGLNCLQAQSRARHDDQQAFNPQAQEQLREVLHHSPRQYGYETSLWTLDLLARVSWEQGWVQQPVHRDTVSATLQRMGLSWKRAKSWISSPDAHYESKKSVAIG